MSTPESSLGARLNDVERKQAVHEAVCEERYKAINEGIAQIRIDLAARGQKMQNLVTAWAVVIGGILATFEYYRRAGGIGLP
jgi:hypothetical protein